MTSRLPAILSRSRRHSAAATLTFLSLAAWTVTADPATYTAESFFREAAPVQDAAFGQRLDVDGERVLVRVPGATGANQRTEVWERSGSTWQRMSGSSMTPSPTAGPSPFFGSSLALYGDLALVGAPGDDSIFPGEGAAYLFQEVTSTPSFWFELAKLGDTEAADDFGCAVDLWGDTAIVSGNGTAYVFERNAGGTNLWSRVAAIDGSLSAICLSVAVYGDWIAVGDPFYEGFGQGSTFNSGGIYVHHRDMGGPGAWGQVQELTLPAPLGDEHLGERVELSLGEEPFFPAIYLAAGGDFGRIGIFRKSAFSSTFESDDVLTDLEIPQFGTSMGLAGQTLIAGGDPALFDPKVAMFRRDNFGAWSLVSRFSSPTGEEFFGLDVSLSDQTVLIGSPLAEIDGQSIAGRIFELPHLVFYDGFESGDLSCWTQ